VAHERVNEGRLHVGLQQHVAFVNGLEAPNGRPVKSDAMEEQIFVELPDGHGEMLHQAWKIGEFEIQELDVVFLDGPDQVSIGQPGTFLE
jgi:hypothetical protein